MALSAPWITPVPRSRRLLHRPRILVLQSIKSQIATFQICRFNLIQFAKVFCHPGCLSNLGGSKICLGKGPGYVPKPFLVGTLNLREAKPGGFQTGGFPTFFGKGPDCDADPFGTVPRRCS